MSAATTTQTSTMGAYLFTCGTYVIKMASGDHFPSQRPDAKSG